MLIWVELTYVRTWGLERGEGVYSKSAYQQGTTAKWTPVSIILARNKSES